MSTHNSERLGPAPLKSLNSFSLPRLKTDVTKKFIQRAESKWNSSGGAEDLENKDASANPPACLDEAASPPSEQAAKELPNSKPTTVRKSRRQAKSRHSEITVYYDAVQSPDDANTVTKQKPRGARAGRAQAKHLTSEVEQDSALVTTAEAPVLSLDCDAQLQAKAPGESGFCDLQQPSVAAGASSSPEMDTIYVKETVAAPAAVANTRRRSKNSDKSPDAQAPATDVQQEAAEQQQQQQQQLNKAAEGLRDGQEIFRYMQQLAEDAAGLLPQDDDQEQKKRGRGRAKKDLRLVDALHQSWNGKSYYERLQEITRHQVEQEEQQTSALGPEYRPFRLSAAATGVDELRDDYSKPSSQSHLSQEASLAANTRKRRTGQPGRRPSAENSDVEMEVSVVEAEAAEARVQADTDAAAAAVPSKRRATIAAGRAAAPAAKGGKPAANASGPTTNRGRRTTIAGASTTVTAAAATSRSPLVSSTVAGNRPPSSKSTAGLACESTPAAAATTGGGLAERPPWSVGGPATGAATGGAGATAGTGAAKVDRSAVQKLQSALEAKTDELTAVKDQLADLQEVVTKLRAEQKAHPKALAQLEKQKQTLEKKVEAAERRQTVLERENEGLQEKLAKQEAEKATLQEQLAKSDKEVRALRAKLKQTTAKLEKCQGIGQKLQEMGSSLAAEAQPVWME